MYILRDEPLSRASVQLLSEALDRLAGAGILRLTASADAAASALAGELRRLGALPHGDTAAAILALRAAGWAPALAGDAEAAARVADTALTAAGMLAREDARHVADYLRHAEEEITGAQRRAIDAVLPEATRAITAYRALTVDPPVTYYAVRPQHTSGDI